MSLTDEIVRNIAELAKLELTDEEVELYREQLSHILDYVDRLDALDTDDIPPTASVLPVKNAFREDIPRFGLLPEIAIANAPDAKDNQFRVDAVLEDEG
jgi:aspartyl-tRNA(Asn)/glutamyl-tRNA(Gln) amidotransferase subunit C